MEFSLSDEIVEFRRELDEFAKHRYTAEFKAEMEAAEEAGPNGPKLEAIKREIDERGWMRMCWPPEMGGQGKPAWFQYYLVNQLSLRGIPYSLGVAGMIGPAIAAFGTDEQKKRYLPPLWSGEMVAALGYSEPNAGTDLASLQTRAVRDGDEYVINGQKIWTSGAHNSTHVWLAARTDPEAPKHRGISMFIVPLDSAGLSVRPIWTSAGVRTNETFYEDVRVPADALIGEENRGWYIAANALDHERVTIGTHVEVVRAFEQLMEYLRERRPDLLAMPRVRERLANLRIDLLIARALNVTNADIVARNETPTMEASMAKVWTSELRYRLSDTALDLLGRTGALRRESGGAAPLEGLMERTYRASPILRFGGGTNEVQRNIIAQRGLGLPR